MKPSSFTVGGLDSDDEVIPTKPKYTDLINEGYYDETDSETEALQEAFAKGILKPGLNVLSEEKKPVINNVKRLQEKLSLFKLNLPWIETLDIINKPANLAPELAKELDDNKGRIDPDVHDDFKRESLFYRQAQGALLEAIPRLHELGVRTARPEDYFAEMAKSDEHMQKVKAKLISQKSVMERIEKVRQMRQQKKIQKAMQAEKKVAKENAKREFLKEVKKFKKGERKDLSFLDEKKPATPLQRKVSKKRQRKDDKFGYGGKKKGKKRNSKESLDNLKKGKGAGRNRGKAVRPGKSKRMQTKKR